MTIVRGEWLVHGPPAGASRIQMICSANERDLRSMTEHERDSEQGDSEGGRRNNSHDDTSVLRSHQKGSAPKTARTKP